MNIERSMTAVLLRQANDPCNLLLMKVLMSLMDEFIRVLAENTLANESSIHLTAERMVILRA